MRRQLAAVPTVGAMADAGPVLVDLFELSVIEQTDAVWFRAILNPEARAQAAEIVGDGIARSLLSSSDDAYAHWAVRRNGGVEHDEATKSELVAYLMSDFEDPAALDRVGGAVAEHLWSQLAPHLEGGWGAPAYVEHEHFSVIDHGGDGISIYDSQGDELAFRLWESKKHASSTTSVTTIVTGAAGQLADNAPRYLARLSKPLQLHYDERIARLAGQIVKLWVGGDARTAVGVSVGTATAGALPSRPFRGLASEFDTLDAIGRREGLIVQVDDLDGFAGAVREILLSGVD